jgi:acetyl-CoA synthetase
MGQGEEFVTKYDRPLDLRLLGSVGEPINPEAWNWYYNVVGKAAAPSSTPGGRRKPAAPDHAAARRDALKPGSATTPFFGVQPVVVDAERAGDPGRRDRGQPVHHRQLAGPDAHRLGRP